MTDPFSAAASGITVITLAAQLAVGVAKLYDFWKSVENAPKEVRSLTADLKVFESVLEEIRQQQTAEPIPTAVTALNSCTQKVNELLSLVDELEPGFQSSSRRSRKWSAIKATMRKDKLKEFCATLEGAKTTLILAHQVSSNQIQRIRHETHQQSLQTITDGINSIQLQKSSRVVTTTTTGSTDIRDHVADLKAEIKRNAEIISNPVLRAGFEMSMNKALEQAMKELAGKGAGVVSGVCNDEEAESLQSPADGDTTVNVQSRTRKATQKQRTTQQSWSRTQTIFGLIYFYSRTTNIQRSYDQRDLDDVLEEYQEFDTFFILHPSQWLIKMGCAYALKVTASWSARGWAQRIEPLRVVPDGSSIFISCCIGDIDGVRRLLANGHASVWDIDSRGATPLHCAAQSGNPGLCKLLLDSGADLTAADYHGNLAYYWTVAMTGPSPATPDIIRLFVDGINFSGNLGMSTNSGAAWRFLLLLLCSGEPLTEGNPAWLFHTFRNEMGRMDLERVLAWAILMAGYRSLFTHEYDPGTGIEQRIYRLIDFSEKIGLRTSYSSPLYMAGAFPGGLEYGKRALTLLLERGADPHFPGPTPWGTPYDKNRTTMAIALERAEKFFVFRGALTKAGYDFADFVTKELEFPCLREEGWNEATLLALFCWEFELIEVPSECRCGCYLQSNYSKKWWERKLEMIKAGQDPDSEPNLEYYPPVCPNCQMNDSPFLLSF